MIEYLRSARLKRIVMRPSMSHSMCHISSFEELNEVMSNLHDCPFDLDPAKFNGITKTWTGVFLRPAWEDPRAEHRGLSLLYVRSRLPVVEATLTLSGVMDQSIVDDQGIGQYSFNEIQRIGNDVRLRYNEAMYVDLYLAGSLIATYNEEPLPGICAIYRQYFLLQTGPKFEQVLGTPAA
jgi:hypothetical protein